MSDPIQIVSRALADTVRTAQIERAEEARMEIADDTMVAEGAPSSDEEESA